MPSDGSITTAFKLLQSKDDAAVQRLWDTYFPQLVEVARKKMRGTSKRAADEEDVALSAFYTFCQAAQNARLPGISDRTDLWRTLVLITAGKVVDHYRYLGAQKRGGCETNHERSKCVSVADLETLSGPNPDPSFALEFEDQLDMLLDRLGDDQLCQTALWRLGGYTNEEIADRLGCSSRTIRRRLTLIRRLWDENDVAR